MNLLDVFVAMTVFKGDVMHRLIFALTMAACANAQAQTYVPGHTRSDGTYVQGHTRSAPDANRYNNYGSQSNGGRQRDEFSSGTGSTNKSNSGYGWRDNDGDGVPNAQDRKPNSKRAW